MEDTRALSSRRFVAPLCAALLALSAASNITGIIVTADGSFSASGLCNVGRPVACCFS